MSFFLHLAIIVAVYSIAALSLDLILGHAGLLSLGQAAFFGLGAYSTAILAREADLGMPVTVLVSFAGGSAVSSLLSISSFRLADDYFVLASFAFSQVTFTTGLNAIPITGGARGISNVPGLFSHEGQGLRLFSGLGIFLVLGGVLAFYGVASRGGFGRALHAIREDAILAQSFGKNTFRLKAEILAWSGGLAALAGSLYAHYMGYVDPSVMSPAESVALLSMVVIGGAGSRWGCVIGAAVIIAAPELLRLLGLPGATAANVRQILYGGLLTMAMLVRPRGLMGTFDFSRR